MREVAITGVGQTICTTRRADVNFPELVREAAQLALASADLTMADVDAVVFGSSPELFEGVNHPEKWCATALGAAGKPLMRIHTGGTVGASTGIAAVYHVGSGVFDTVLAVTGDKLSESPVQLGLSTVYDPVIGRQFACGAPAAVALQSRLYMHRTGCSERHGAMVAVKNRLNALRNPVAQLRIPEITIEMVLESPMIASPLRLLDACPASDGACAMVLTTGARARDRGRPAARVDGVSAVAEGVNYPGRDWARPLALEAAAKRAYAQAGIGDPATEIDVAELYEAFSYQELIWSEAIGLAAPDGGGWRRLENGETQLGGALPINPSGGVLSTNTIGATAMMRQAEAALQVMGQAGEHQVDGARRAVAHGWGGAIQFHTMMVLSAMGAGA